MIPLRDVNPTRVVPIFTILIIAINIAAFVFFQPRSGPGELEFLYENAAIACELTSGEPLTIVEAQQDTCTDAAGPQIAPDKSVLLSVGVSMFLHGGWLHLLSNMWFLWIFGNNVEEAFGSIGYLLLYAFAGIVATVGFVAVNADSTIPLVGASGAIAGILGAYLVLFPRHRILTLLILIVFPLVIGVPAIIFLGLWFVGQFSLADPNVAVEAHIVGFAVGVIVAVVLRSKLLKRVATLENASLRRF